MCEDMISYKGFTETGSRVYWDAIKAINDRYGTVDLKALQEAVLSDSMEGVLWTWKTVNLNERG